LRDFNALPGLDESRLGKRIVCRPIGAPGEALIRVTTEVWRWVCSERDLLDEVVAAAFRLPVQTLPELSQMLLLAHKARGTSFEPTFTYLRGRGVSVHGRGRPRKKLARWYGGYFRSEIAECERRLSAICAAEMIVHCVSPHYISIHEDCRTVSRSWHLAEKLAAQAGTVMQL